MARKKRRRRPGRPSYEPTLKDRERVAISAGGGMSHEEIAIALNIDRKTLEKHFEHELSVGAHQKRMEVLEAMHSTAVKGNVSAQKAYWAASVPISAPPLPPAAPGQEAAPPADSRAPEGKKAQAQADAKVAQRGTDWETLLPGPTRQQ